ncbi:MAG: thioredoxin family protein [Bacilli bacterium]
MKKKRIIYISIILFVIVIIGSTLYVNNRTFINIKTNKLNELVKDSNKKLIYIGRPTCGGCIEVQPILKEEVDKNDLQAYYYDTDKAKKKEYDAFQDVKADFKIESIPLILYYKEGKEVARFDYSDFEKSKEDSIGEFIKNNILE